MHEFFQGSLMTSLAIIPRKTTTVLRPKHALLLLAIVLSIVGCGSSQNDIMMRAARRSRDPDDVEEKSPVNNVAATPVQPAASTTPVPSGPAEASPIVPKAEATEPPSTVSVAAIKPISERKPKTPLTDGERRQRALDNIEKISKAILNLYGKNKAMTGLYMASSGGIPTLSWRVALLPEMGYDELYSKFNPEEPWDGPNNKKLLELIPDEFVSPERFDIKTNYLLPAGPPYIFGTPNFTFGVDSDRADSTILLVEVNDERAIPWTMPGDYTDYGQGVKNGIGKLRGDGTYAVWGNGWPVLLGNNLSWQEIDNAFSASAGDGQLAGQVHRSITIEGVTEPSTTADVAAVPEVQIKTPMPAPEPVIKREAIPDPVALGTAGKRLREVYAKKLEEAIDDDKKSEAAREMLDEAKLMEDPASAYVLQSAAVSLASESGEFPLVVESTDMRVGRFDVDAYEENMTALTNFGSACATREASDIDGIVYLQRALPTVFAAIKNDDYVRAATIVRYAFKFVDQPRNETIPKSLNALRVQLASAQRSFDAAKESLAKYRVDSSDGESAATFGRFLCFIKGDWEAGLPLMLQGGSDDLRNLVEADLNGAKDVKAQVALGDSWWELAERAKAGVYRQAGRDRAAHWYRQAFAVMPESLDKLHVKARLDEAGDASKSSPLTLVRSLAEEINVDLKVSLASIALTGQRVQNAGQTENDE